MAQTNALNEDLQKIIDQAIDHKKVYGASYALKKKDYLWHGTSGNLSAEQPFFIASTTKLFTSAIIMRLLAEGRLSLQDPIRNYFDSSVLQRLHIFKGKDYSNDITIKHLLSHTSGLPDYFQDKAKGMRSLHEEIINGRDRSWSFEDIIQRTKLMKPHFAPGTRRKAHYSDTNYQLLGKIIEIVTQKTFAENCDALIINPLGLRHTYLYTNPTDTTPMTLYYRDKPLHIPKAMASFGPDGGMVSTSGDMLVFIEAFFTGKLFPQSYLEGMQEWNRIFFPFRSGTGIHLFKLPWFMNPGGRIPYFIGHSGLSGALAFYCPGEHMFISGTVNQAAHPELSFKMMVRLTQCVQKKSALN